MLKAISLTLLTLWVTSFTLFAQVLVSEPCRSQTATGPELGLRLQKLEQERMALQSRLAPGTVETVEMRILNADLRRTQESMLEVLFALECLRTDFYVDPALKRGPQDVPQWIEFTVFYGTNRKRVESARPEERYVAEVLENGKWAFGQAVVSIPTARKPGTVPQHSLWRFELRPDPSKHFIIKGATELSLSEARADLASRITRGAKSALLFVHGFNVTFADAAVRSAQLAHDLSFPGVALFFSWPSVGKTLAYWRDEETVQLSELAFDQFINEVASVGFEDVYIVAHSMGNRLVANVLGKRVDSNRRVGNLREILLAAPDINEQLFREQIAPKMAALQGVRRTIYASSRDVALRASKVIHDYRRVGETSGGVSIFAGFESIDASATAPTLRAFGHSYVVDSIKVLGDIEDLISLNFDADRRKLHREGTPPKAFWVLK